MYTCNLCNLTFFSKQSLQTHENKKRKCNIPTEFKCNKCNKFFTQNKNLKYHTDHDSCKINNSYTINNKPIILDSKNDIYYI